MRDVVCCAHRWVIWGNNGHEMVGISFVELIYVSKMHIVFTQDIPWGSRLELADHRLVWSSVKLAWAIAISP